MRLALLALVGVAFPLGAQDIVVSPLDGTVIEIPEETPVTRTPVLEAPAATLRGLDKVTGESFAFALRTGASAEIGRLSVTLAACRYPEDNATGEAYAWIEILTQGQDAPEFAEIG
ncbi:MAG: DUF2155 domain-containing protein, partial [Pseudomonadota bacterium]